MESLQSLADSFATAYNNPAITTRSIVLILGVAVILSLYEWLVYRTISHRAFYNKSFHICIAVLPLFICSIIFSLQSNLLITLGTIGALAILRFRTAIKDPVDMLYLLWSVFIGITVGCQLFELAVMTSLAATLLLLFLEWLPLQKKPYVLLFRCEADKSKSVLELLKNECKGMRIKSRSHSSAGMDYVVEFRCKDPDALCRKLESLSVERFSVVSYDSDDIL